MSLRVGIVTANHPAELEVRVSERMRAGWHRVDGPIRVLFDSHPREDRPRWQQFMWKRVSMSAPGRVEVRG